MTDDEAKTEGAEEPSIRVRRKIAIASTSPPIFENERSVDEVSRPDDNTPVAVLDDGPVIRLATKAMTPVEPTSNSPPLVAKIIFSLGLLLLATLTAVADSQLAKQVYSPHFNAPFLMMYTNQISRIFTFPVFLLTVSGWSRVKHREFGVRETLTDAAKFLGPKGPTILSVLRIVCVMGIINILALGVFLSSLRTISATEATTLLTSQVAMTYIISVIFLKQQIITFKIFATGVTFVGVGLMAYGKGFLPDSIAIAGVAFALAAAVLYAFGQVYMKIVLKTPNIGQISLYMSSTSTFVLLTGWVVPLCMKITGNENWEFDTAPWLRVFASGLAALLTAFIVNYGISVTNPFFMSLHNLAKIPINNLIDTYAWGQAFSAWDWGGATCIIVGFILIIIPDDRVSVRIKERIEWFSEKRRIRKLTKRKTNNLENDVTRTSDS